MNIPLYCLIHNILNYLGTNASLRAENLALRHQVAVLKRKSSGRLQLNNLDRIVWVWLSRFWTDWRSSLVIVKPAMVVSWHRLGFRLYWRWRSRNRKLGRPTTPRDVRYLIRQMSDENVLWGAQRILDNLC